MAKPLAKPSGPQPLPVIGGASKAKKDAFGDSDDDDDFDFKPKKKAAPNPGKKPSLAFFEQDSDDD